MHWLGEEQITIYKGVKPSPRRRVLKSSGKFERENLKRTISANSGSKSLQIVSEPDTGQCVSLIIVLSLFLEEG